MSFVRCLVVLCGVVLVLPAPTPTATAAVPTGGHVLPAQATPPRQFLTYGDYVHISSSSPRAVSAHGWWVRIDNEAPLALVRVQLQIKRAGLWLDAGSPGLKVVKPGGG